MTLLLRRLTVTDISSTEKYQVSGKEKKRCQIK